MKQKLLIYMPALNEADTIYNVIESIPKSFGGFNTIEVLVVNDGSKDQTEEEAIKACATVVSHPYNKGVGNAFQTAINYALQTNADVLVSIDADGQFDVGEIKNLVAPILNNEADFTLGNRFSDQRPEKMPKIKFLGNKKISQIVSYVGNTKIQDVSCGFRAYSKESLLNLNLQGDFTYTHETILDLLNKGKSVAQIPITVKYFDGRVSRIANSITKYAFKTSIIIFKCLKDYKPFRFFISIAFGIFVLAMLLGGFVFWHWMSTGQITPYKSFGFIALSLCGMSLVVVTLAFIADMLNRIRQNQEKILYLTKKKYFEVKSK
ncbi:glycosyltransferase family 2 protein [Algibacter sp. L1A34]|uniref:glycosyltransferase family 2 protein n=1 Tax=Algibacter sp. L1A34 TaxID=2686365 RepID=UPI00131D322B|nr:glycosyltransferase family 2 protein [Algibacter sp. L1A34]